MAITPITPPTTSLQNARIGYKNLLTASTTAGADAMLVPNTWERYLPLNGSFQVRMQLSSASQIDFVAIAAHNVGTHNGGTTIDISYTTTVGGSLIGLLTWQPTDNSAMMHLMQPVNAAEVVLSFGTSTGMEIGIFYAGLSLEMQHGIYGGHSPIVLSGKTSYQSVMSDTGQFLGRNIVRQGVESAFSWRHLGADWYRENFKPFAKSARNLPFFIKCRPDLYPDEVAFGHTTSDISPMNMTGGSGLMEVDFKMLGHEDVS